MFYKLFDDVPSIAKSIPEPLKEEGATNPNATKIHDTIPKNVDVNVNVNTKDLPKNNSPEGVDETGVSSDTATLPDQAVREWTEPHNADDEVAVESWGMCTRTTRYMYTSSINEALVCLKPANMAIYSDLHMAATESFSNFVFRGLTGVVNVVGHMVNLFRTALFDGWRDFKRSELTAYCQSNVATIHHLRHSGLDFDKCANLDVYVPQGMTSDYIKTTNAMFAYLDELNLYEMSKQMIEVCENILVNLRSSNNKVFNDAIRDAYARYTNTSRLNSLFNDTEKYMTTKKVDMMKCSQAFPGKATGFSEILDMLLGKGNSYLQSVAAIHSRLEEVEELVKEIAEYANRVQLTRQQLDMLSKLARAWAVNFDRFATVINDVYRIDHNVTLDIVQIRKYLEI